MVVVVCVCVESGVRWGGGGVGGRGTWGREPRACCAAATAGMAAGGAPPAGAALTLYALAPKALLRQQARRSCSCIAGGRPSANCIKWHVCFKRKVARPSTNAADVDKLSS